MNFVNEKKVRQPTESMIGLINIIFLLLIFFMLVGTLSTPDALDVEPPESVAERQQPTDEIRILMSITESLAIDQQLTSRSSLVAELSRLLGENPDRDVRLVADAGLPAESVVTLLQELAAAGIDNIVLATRQK